MVMASPSPCAINRRIEQITAASISIGGRIGLIAGIMGIGADIIVAVIEKDIIDATISLRGTGMSIVTGIVGHIMLPLFAIVLSMDRLSASGWTASDSATPSLDIAIDH